MESPGTVVVAVGFVVAFGGHRAVGRLLDPLFRRIAAGTGRDPADPGLAWELAESDATKLLAAGLLVAYVLLVEGRGPGSLTGRRLSPPLAVVAVAGGLAVMLGQNVVAQPLYDRLGVGGDMEEDMTDLGSLSLPQRLVVALVAGVTEEVLFRGYPIERLVELTGSPLLAGGVSVVAFGLAHYGFWDRGSTVKITVTGAILTGIYLVTRSLPVVIAVHALNDLMGLLIAARMDGAAGDGGRSDVDGDGGRSDVDGGGGRSDVDDDPAAFDPDTDDPDPPDSDTDDPDPPDSGTDDPNPPDSGTASGDPDRSRQ